MEVVPKPAVKMLSMHQSMHNLLAPAQSEHPVYTPLEEEEEPDQGTPACIIRETDTPKERWDLLVMCCIFYSALIVPLRLCFHAEAEGLVWDFEASMSLIFLTDLCLSFNTAYLSEGEWVTSRRKIASRYLRSWFWIDAPSSLPVEFIEVLLPPGSDTGALPAFRILRMLRLVRMLRLLKVGVYVARLEEELEISLRPLRVVELVVQMLFIAHMLACGWFTTTWLSPPRDAASAASEDDEGLEWSVKSAAEGAAWEDDPTYGLTWIERYDHGSAADGPVSRQYFLSLYWAICTLFAINPIPAATDGERKFVMVVNVVNRLLLAYIVGKISSLIAQLDRQAAMVQDKLDMLNEYLQWRGTPKVLSIRIKRYYEYYYQRQAVYDETAILSGLSPTLKGELVRSNSTATLGRLPLFAKLSPDFLEHIFPLVKPLSFTRGEAVYTSGEAAKGLIFLLEGKVDMLSELDNATPVRRIQTDLEIILGPYPKQDELVRVDGVGCFGQEVLVGVRRRCTTVASSNVETLFIERDDLVKLFRQSGHAIDVRRIIANVLAPYSAREHLSSFKVKMRRSAAYSAGNYEQSAALALNLCWRRHRKREAARSDELTRLVQGQLQMMGSPTRKSGSPPRRGGMHTTPTPDAFLPKGGPLLHSRDGGMGSSLGMQELQERILQRLESIEKNQESLRADVSELLRRPGKESRSMLGAPTAARSMLGGGTSLQKK